MKGTKPHYIDGTKDAWFSRWTKVNLRSGSSGLKITDIDSLRIWYAKDLQKYMLIELKKKCETLTVKTMEVWQKEVFKQLDFDLRHSTKYLGFYLIAISSIDTINEDTIIHISDRSYLHSYNPTVYQITLTQLICFLNFDVRFERIIEKIFNGYYVKKYEGQGDLFRDIVVTEWTNEYLPKEFRGNS